MELIRTVKLSECMINESLEHTARLVLDLVVYSLGGHGCAP